MKPAHNADGSRLYLSLSLIITLTSIDWPNDCVCL